MPSTYPSVADVETVAAITEPVLRNLRITVAYGQLAVRDRDAEITLHRVGDCRHGIDVGNGRI